MTSIHGATAPQRAWGLAPVCRAQKHRSIVHRDAPSRCPRSILPCRPTLAVLQLCLQRTLALLWQSREDRA